MHGNNQARYVTTFNSCATMCMMLGMQLLLVAGSRAMPHSPCLCPLQVKQFRPLIKSLFQPLAEAAAELKGGDYGGTTVVDQGLMEVYANPNQHAGWCGG